VLDRLADTDSFSNPDKLSLADRKLILYLVVTLADESRRLTAAYEAVLRAYSGVRGHWAHGKPLAVMQKYCAKFLGKSAERRPTWDKVEDVLRAALPADRAEVALAEAAWLFSRAAGVERPPGYSGELSKPVWDQPSITVVTAAMIAGPARPSKPIASDDQLLVIKAQARAYRALDREKEELSGRFDELLREIDRLRAELRRFSDRRDRSDRSDGAPPAAVPVSGSAPAEEPVPEVHVPRARTPMDAVSDSPLQRITEVPRTWFHLDTSVQQRA
jgi:hypothetical protein